MFMRFKNIYLLIILCCFVMLPQIAYANDIKNIRFGKPKIDTHRIVIELSADPDFKSFLLENPSRLVVDIPFSNFKAPIFSDTNNPIIHDYRFGKPKQNIGRVVFDLKLLVSSIQTTSFVLKPSAESKNYRLIVDIKTSKNREHSVYTGKVINIPLPQRKPSILNNIYTIAIDAGHGGKDPGAINGRTREKNITLSLSKQLKQQLERTGRYKVILTRPHDKFVKLRKRVNIARKAGADLFISLHADKIERRNVHGTSIYTLSEKASDSESAKLAKRENEVDIIAGIDLSHEDEDVADILIDLAMRDTMNHSNVLANTIITSFRANRLDLLKTAHRSAGFAVLKAPDIPSVLIEAGFISNNKEAKLLNSITHQRKIAKAIANSINMYFTKIENSSL